MDYFLSTILLALLSVSLAAIPEPTKKWTFSQTLDHFTYNEVSAQTFDQRVFEYDKFWSTSDDDSVGPLFVYTGNEGSIEDFYENTGFMFDIAPKFGAFIVFIEHRYYGESLPFGQDSFEPEKMRYLSSMQATSDFAQVINYYKTHYNITQVVAFGGSYGGMLAAWMRMRYPQLVDIALAASSPLPMMAKIAEPKQAFFEIVTNDFGMSNEQCPTIVRNGFTKLYSLYYQGSSNFDEITKSFKLCSAFNESQFDHLVGWVRNAMLTMAMVDYPYSAEFLGSLPAWPVDAACKIMLNEMATSNDPMKAIVEAAGLFYNGTNGQKECFEIYDEFIECADLTGCGTGSEAIAWDFQCCTEFQLASPSNNITDMFPPFEWDPEIVGRYCKEHYGVTPDPVLASREYWSADFKTASNIIFSNGLLDPWHAGGVLEDVNRRVKAILIKDGAHHLDLRGHNPKDPKSVIAARKKEVSLIKKWLKRN